MLSVFFPGSKVSSGSSEYLVKWEGLPYSNSTSEDAELIERLFPKVVEEYFYRRNNTCTPNPNNRASCCCLSLDTSKFFSYGLMAVFVLFFEKKIVGAS